MSPYSPQTLKVSLLYNNNLQKSNNEQKKFFKLQLFPKYQDTNANEEPSIISRASGGKLPPMTAVSLAGQFKGV
jgi:hypothetical protein